MENITNDDYMRTEIMYIYFQSDTLLLVDFLENFFYLSTDVNGRKSN